MAVRGKTLINQARDSTDRVEDFIGTAWKALHADRWCNGYGVYTDRSTVRANLRTAKAAIEGALQEIDQPVDWPNNDDYDHVGA